MGLEHDEIQGRNLSELRNYRDLAHHLTQLAMRGLLRTDFLNEVSMRLLTFAGCDSVEIWLMERGRYYSCEVNRQEKHKFNFSILRTKKDRNNKVIPIVRDKHLPESMLRDLVSGNIDVYKKNMTKKGSFYTGSAVAVFSEILKNAGVSEKNRFIHSTEFKSLAIIPISLENKNIGLIQLKGKDSNFFSQQDVEFYENIVHTLGMSLIHRRTQVKLGERIKELTCLYGIAKLVEKSALSLTQVLHGIVELLPPAWLYPEIASAQIVLDGKLGDCLEIFRINLKKL